MQQREEVTNHHYLATCLAWYVSTIVSGAIATWLIVRGHSGDEGMITLALEIGGAILTILAVISPLAVGIVLRRMNDPAAGMTASAALMLGHILLISGPFILLTPIVSRHLAVQRHNSGGY